MSEKIKIPKGLTQAEFVEWYRKNVSADGCGGTCC